MSLKRNFIYSGILTVSNYIFPLIVFPYVSRVLGVSNIGVFNFVDNVINYFIIFSMMGINTIGLREIASKKNDRKLLDKTFSSLISLNAIFTASSFLILLICIFSVPKFYQYQNLMFIGALKLLFNFLLLDWLYNGLEEFKYITERTLAVKIIYVIAIFIFVRHSYDYQIYYLLTTMVIVINAIINLTKSRQYVTFSFKSINVFSYIKPFLQIGLYMILTTTYTAFNIVYLGFMSSPEEVGCFTTAYKITMIFLALYTAWTNVVMPRMSYLYSNGDLTAFVNIVLKSTSALLTFTIPIIILGVIFSPDIIHIIVGKGYEGAILPLRIQIPLILVIGYSQILVLQILMPIKRDKLLVRISFIGAVIGIIINIISVPHLKSVGSSISWFLSELVVMAIAQHFTSKKVKVIFPWKTFIKNVIAFIPALLICMLLYFVFKYNYIIRFVTAAIFMVSYTILIQYAYLKDALFMTSLKKIVNKIK